MSLRRRCSALLLALLLVLTPAFGQRHRTHRRGQRAVPVRAAGRGYINVDGEYVRSPTLSHRAPAGASARCRDGTYSFSRHRQGTCSHHGGVAVWL